MARRSEPWRSYAAGSEVRHFSDFCKTHLIQSEDRWEGKPLALEPWQRRMLGEALAYDANGWPLWRSIVFVVPRKNGKTQLLAALALYRLLTGEGAPGDSARGCERPAGGPQKLWTSRTPSGYCSPLVGTRDR